MRNDRVHRVTSETCRFRSAVARRVALALFTCSVIATSGAGFELSAAPTAPAGARADQLLVVDCLLPGQIRHLGQRSVYLSPRRPARLPARDCQIRGGEYVAYDRADLASALGAWRPLAEQGDVEAQVIVGEIFERGLGVAPDYTAARSWYRRAADAGSRRAQVNLGYLYERGLGMPADAAVALDWYRRAAGRETTVLLDPATEASPPLPPLPAAGPATDGREPRAGVAAPPVDAAEVARLRARTMELDQALAELRAELEASRKTLGATQQALGATTQRLDESQQELELARSRAAAAEAQAAEARREPTAAPTPPDRTAEIAALQRELQQRSDEASTLAAELAAARADIDRRQADLDRATHESAAARAAAADERARLTAAAARLAEREQELARRREESEQLGRELAAATALAIERQRQIERLERPIAAGLLAGPEITLVMPELSRVRDIVPVAHSAGPEVPLVGRITAPAGIVAVTVNNRPVATSEVGVFSLSMPVGTAQAPVTIVAVDRQGKRAELRFVLRGIAPAPPATIAGPVADDRSLAAGIDFGTYHALVIGNNDYRSLPDLSSPINDATALARLLEQRYGFRTTVLLNADRYQILSALNGLRETLTSRDNLLVYFAGHGELDEVNQRAHWLPVDAERTSTANWIPTTAVTDILNIMQARQILMVVDSCYAGALTRSSVARLRTGMTPEERLHWFRTLAAKRSRTVLTSGGIAPVMDAGGGKHSVFARALLAVLEANGDVLDGQRLHREVAARVAYAAANLRFDQVPEYAPIRFAGHEAGEFFLVPRS